MENENKLELEAGQSGQIGEAASEQNSGTSNGFSPPDSEKKPVWRKIKAKQIIAVAIILAVCALLYYYRSIFFAASVNGKLISRLSVIRELESQSGKQALDFLINEKLVEFELKKSNIEISDEELSAKVGNISSNIEKQGSTLAATLALQGMTEQEFENRITTQLKLEKMLADKINVTDAEIDGYIKENKITFSKDMDIEEARDQIRENLKQNKFNQEADIWFSSVKSNASIKYFVDY